ncbi:hypothetical protein Mal4_28640 [Maioricimonas rarisocia]|uniref:Uncharacterized protein n=1 Tax=Maioricimonas rarisocia TaxID=2528026 RepID=A0A517Z7U2_9PLAN|nr:hypothetical protein [Maioricimonas rarisocia]QDU38535.1 hypothetical protein Mal4_28640 [Maioricimonas rarisocia]
MRHWKTRAACIIAIASLHVALNVAIAEETTAGGTALVPPGERHSDHHLEQIASGDGARSFSGIYPHLASFNRQGECGTGAVVPWADRLWWITYAPHKPRGSDDQLYAASPELDLFTWTGSVGGTPANRMIHRESQQLLIGPYVIDRQGKIRVIPPDVMPGRLTGNARHLFAPADKVYYATMEEGFYEVDVRSLEVTELFPDSNGRGGLAGKLLPGYHGKGLYSGQGRLVYANNGEVGRAAQTRPDIDSGALAEWDGEGDWRVVLRNQFTEVTGPGGLYGNDDPEKDPIWSIGWDHRSLILMLRDGGEWHRFRLPKASHCYDGAHGWNTEWPRIRDIGEDDLLMTMHGTFWRFPRTFRSGQTAGIRPRSTYLKVIGDFCRWEERVVFGCDDSAQKEFLNTRKSKGELAGPAQSQSNLWFVEPDQIDRLGPAIGRGAVWLDDDVTAGTPSDPFLFDGYDHRSLMLAHDGSEPVSFRLEVDRTGNGTWTELTSLTVPPGEARWHFFVDDDEGAWIRVVPETDCNATACFELRDRDERDWTPDRRFAGLARPGGGESRTGLLRAGDRDTGLQVLASTFDGAQHRPTGYYELKPDLRLVRVDSEEEQDWMAKHVAIPTGVLTLDGYSILYVDDDGNRFRLPLGNPDWLERSELLDQLRAAREVCTERDLFHCAGTFYELPARNAGGFAKLRPVSTHPYLIHDYCSWRGLMVLSGIDASVSNDNPHIVRSSDGNCAVWLGTVDDLWSLGKPVGIGGPWSASKVESGVPSDPFLMAGFDRKSLMLVHDSDTTVTFDVEVDVTGTGKWHRFTQIDVPAGELATYRFPADFNAYWVRLISSRDVSATARFEYH